MRIGADAVVSSLSRLTWWQLLVICLPYGAIMAVDTLGWRYAFSSRPPPYARMLAARMAGEALNIVTALGSVGGEAVKVWLLRPAVPYAESVPSIVIAKTTITIAQALFLVAGLIVAGMTVVADRRLITGMFGLLLVEVLAVGGFFLAQVLGLVRHGGRLLAWAGVVDEIGQAERLDTSLRHFYRHQWRQFVVSVAFHLAGWFLGVLETIVILFVLDIPVSVATATVFETFSSGVRFATFLVPGNLGVLEGANAGIFAALGLGASAGLAFTLVRRARQVIWIGVGLLVLVVARLQAAAAGVDPHPTAP